ncbi:MAPEG family protein [Cognatishimia sp. MH4019]|uniref:MAPEG family protein n=1 Tax=Cognatishimia sp. MH4019 TaxID=2854030 RepID=UPI001CD25BE6|nr:MAPEG family protein [Cognatishimia sp. MH4019]
MSIELTYLTLSALLAASLWLPFIIGVNATEAREVADFKRPPDLRQMPAWVHRANRAHLNMIEQFLPFAAVVLVAHLQGVSTGLTVIAATALFWLRVAHAVGMISGLARFPVRPVIFTAGWICILLIGGAVLLA